MAELPDMREVRRPSPDITDRLLLRAPGAAALCSISVRTWQAWHANGRVPRPVSMGRSNYWRTDELRAWVAAGCPRRREWETR
jgi:predicted DNA-binding transcriptional regulator AlpA